jgi:hypothetical protein
MRRTLRALTDADAVALHEAACAAAARELTPAEEGARIEAQVSPDPQPRQRVPQRSDDYGASRDLLEERTSAPGADTAEHLCLTVIARRRRVGVVDQQDEPRRPSDSR